MNPEIQSDSRESSDSMPPGDLKKRAWKRFLRGPDQEVLNELYVPALSEAVRYDRCCAYFSSTVLAAAARGFGKLIERLLAMEEDAPRPAVRLVVNEEMQREDVRALLETGDVSKLETLLRRRLHQPKRWLEKHRLRMLGWLVKKGWLEIRVGIMRHGVGIVHAKYGMIYDESGNAIVFNGSGNESASGVAANYERLEVSPSWEDPERFQEYENEFQSLWSNAHPDVLTVPLPEALRLKLIKFAAKEPPIQEPSNALERQKAAMVWKFFVESPYLPNGGPACDATPLVEMWPHQRQVVEETTEAWPEGRMLCDEVGMGKTIEAILILRRLMAGRGVKRALLLLPAGLVKQWQEELREKVGLVFPRLENTTALIWPGGKIQKVNGLNEALQQDVLLLSRETARTETNRAILLAAEPWDLVLLDEGHAARRRKQEEGEFNSASLLLQLLRDLQLRRQAKSILILSATPMQTHPWEPWDLLAVLGVGGHWLPEFSVIRDYYDSLGRVRAGCCDLESARRTAEVIAHDSSFPKPPTGDIDPQNADQIRNALAFIAPSHKETMVQWLRQGSPLVRHMHRNTRNTLRRYYENGWLNQAPPERKVCDIVFDFEHPAEREVYDQITQYIDKRFADLESEKPGKGFVMTVYRRRASSSPEALEKSLQRRRSGLQRVVMKKSYDFTLSLEDIPEDLDLDDLPEDEEMPSISSAFPQDPQKAQKELEEVENLLNHLTALRGQDSKRDRFYEVLQDARQNGGAVLVFTEYWDTLVYLRDSLVITYSKTLGCYSGRGGHLWDGQEWRTVTKDEITKALERGEISVLLCTDAASEGLNLQAASAVINYDLPWNPSKIEQRIGRIDRIGQKQSYILVYNLFLTNSVDDRVYGVLKIRCGLFQHFVGAMQPVLARARKMLKGEEALDLGVLETTVHQVHQDPLAQETYHDDIRGVIPKTGEILDRNVLRTLCRLLTNRLDLRVRLVDDSQILEITGLGPSPIRYGLTQTSLERDPSLIPFSPLDPQVRKFTESLWQSGERLPLVIESYQQKAFRTAMAYWIGTEGLETIASLDDLLHKVERWDGRYPDPTRWHQACNTASQEAKIIVQQSEQRAHDKVNDGLRRQLEAARVRLLCELGRYLVCAGGTTGDLNQQFYHLMNRDIASAHRLQECYNKLGDYPEWTDDIQQMLLYFNAHITESQRKARILGNELDAALQDPRWMAKKGLERI